MKSKRTGERAGEGGVAPPASALGSGRGKSGDPAITVSQLATRIDHAVKLGLSETFTVVGEISSLSHRTHYYFSLKDDQCVIGAVLFASAARRLSYTPAHGDSVLARGRVEYYAPSGRISLIVSSMTPVGEGELERRYKELCVTLRDRGWFDPSLKRPIPVFPRRIAVVTSKDGAAVQDVIDTMGKRCPGIEIVIVDVRVQGAQAAAQIAGAIRALNARRDLGIDAILLTRGGGSLEDLWAFNELQAAQAIHDSTLPIVAAIGHETDTTIAELVADERCATPTQAAMRLSPDRDALCEQLASAHARLDRSVRSQLRFERERLNRIASSRSVSDPREVIAIHRDRLDATARRMTGAANGRIAQGRSALDSAAIRLARHRPSAVHARREEQLDQISQRLRRVMNRAIDTRAEELVSISRELHAIGPAQVLARGFSVTSRPDGSLLRSARAAAPGETLVTTLADGKIRSTVEGADRSGAGDQRLAAASRAPKRGSGRKRNGSKGNAGGEDQMDLFG